MKFDIHAHLNGIIQSEWDHAKNSKIISNEKYNLYRALYSEAKVRCLEAEVTRLESVNHAYVIGVSPTAYREVRDIVCDRLDSPAWVGTQRYREVRDNTASKKVFDTVMLEVVRVPSSE